MRVLRCTVTRGWRRATRVFVTRVPLRTRDYGDDGHSLGRTTSLIGVMASMEREST
jgi:hypothetical protein